MGDFLGRFHPLVVHLPIGILILAALAGVLLIDKQYIQYRNVLRWVYLTGTLCAGVSVLTGLYLAPVSSYEEANLFWHKWSGISLLVLGVLSYWKCDPIRPKFIFPILNIGLLILLTITGHLGGRMTHGPDYLIHRTETRDSSHRTLIQDSTILFEGLILPILQMKCIRCHQQEVKNGGLDLSSFEGIKAGSRGESIIEPGQAAKSELFKRVSLPAHHPRFMPPNGPGLSYDEMRLLEWWLDQGASPDKKIGQLVKTPGIETYLERIYGLHSGTVDPFAGVNAPPVSKMLLDSIERLGFSIQPVVAEKYMLDVVPQKPNQPLTAGQLAALLSLKEQIVWLNLAGTELDDESLKIIGQLPQLRKLHLERNRISDQGLSKLSNLLHLEYLNVFGNSITDQGMVHLSKLPKLKELFIGQTKVTEQGIQSLKQSNTGIEITGDTELFKIIN